MNSKPSKSANKRAAQAVQALGERLLELSDEQLARMPMDDELRTLVVETRCMRSNSALRRQRLYLAKVLRNMNLDALTAAVAALDQQGSDERRRFHLAERWRDRLLAEGRPALQALEEQTGAPCAPLGKLLDQLRDTLPEREQRRLRREIFRAVHAALAAGVQNGHGNG